MSISIVKLFFWNAARKRDEMLEPCDGKLSRTVLRRESGSNPADLAGTIFGGFAPNSKTADELSRSLGSYTVQSGSVSRSKGENSQSLQMAERALMTPDELKAIPKGEFVVMKTGSHPMRTRLRLFMDWGKTFGKPYQTPEHGQRKVYYAGREELERAIIQKFWTETEPEPELEQTEKDRPPQRERPGQRGRGHSRQDAPAGQSIVTASNFAKRQETPPPASDRW